MVRKILSNQSEIKISKYSNYIKNSRVDLMEMKQNWVKKLCQIVSWNRVTLITSFICFIRVKRRVDQHLYQLTQKYFLSKNTNWWRKVCICFDPTSTFKSFIRSSWTKIRPTWSSEDPEDAMYPTTKSFQKIKETKRWIWTSWLDKREIKSLQRQKVHPDNF